MSNAHYMDGLATWKLVYPWALNRSQGMSTSPVGVTIDAAGEKAGCVGIVPKTGSVTKVHIRTGTVTTGDTVDVRLETVATDGTPSGTLWATNTNASLVVANTDDNKVFAVTLTAAASVTRGDVIALVIANGAGGGNMAWNGMNNVFLNARGSYFLYTASAWGGKTQGSLSWMLEYSDGTFEVVNLCAFPYATGSGILDTVTLTSGQQAGVRLLAPFTGSVWGMWAFKSNSATAGDDQFKLYRAATTDTPIASSAVYDRDLQSGTSNAGFVHYPFSSSVRVQAGEELYAMLEASSANSAVYKTTAESASHLAVWEGGTDIYQATRAGTTGAFSTSTAIRIHAGIVYEQISSYASPTYQIGI